MMQPTPQPLDAKVVRAMELLDDVAAEYGPGGAAVAWTGGKDSTVALDIWRRVVLERFGEGAHLRALTVDTGLKFPEVTAFRRELAEEWGVEVATARPGVDIETYPVAEDRVACCAELKVEPLKRAVAESDVKALIVAVRGDEHAARAGAGEREPKDDPPHERIHPLLAFSEMDVWSYTIERGLPYCELYDQGYRSLGCTVCTEASSPGGGERSGRDAAKEDSMAVLRSLGYF